MISKLSSQIENGYLPAQTEFGNGDSSLLLEIGAWSLLVIGGDAWKSVASALEVSM
jgi:hypothetical protein